MKSIAPLISIVLVLAAITSAGIGYLRFYYIPSKAEESILWSIMDLGFENLQIEHVSHQNGSLILQNVSLDEKSFSTIEKITIDFGVFSYFFQDKGISKITVSGITLTGAINENHELLISGIDPSENFWQQLSAMQAKRIAIVDARADILSPLWGGVFMDFEGDITLADGIKFIGNVRSTQNNLRFAATINGDYSGKGRLKIQSNFEGFYLAGEDFALRRGIGKSSIEYSRGIRRPSYLFALDFPSGRFKNAPLHNIKLEALSTDGQGLLKLSGKAGQQKNMIAWNWERNADRRQGNLSINPGYIENLFSYFDALGAMDTVNGIPSYIKSLPIEEISISFNDLKHYSKGRISINSPVLENNVTGDFNATPDGTKIHGALRLPTTAFLLHEASEFNANISSALTFKIDMSTPTYEVEWTSKSNLTDGALSITPQIHTSRLASPTITHSNQKKALNYIPLTFQLPLKNNVLHQGTMSLSLDEGKTAKISDFKVNIFGGTLKAVSPLINNGLMTSANKLIVSDIQIGKLFRSAGFNEIAAWGEIGGVLPMIIDGKNIRVRDGILQSQGKGIIKIPAYIIAGLFRGSSKKMREIRATLRNYHFEFFEVRMDGLLNERALITLNSRGYNPDLGENKDPIDINLQIETQISMIFENMLEK